MLRRIFLASLVVTLALTSTPIPADAGIWLRAGYANGKPLGGAGR